jgi:hypothetical protein
MGLLDELGMKPGDMTRMAMERELQARRDRWDRPGYVYRGVADLLLQHGEFFKGRVLPEQWAHFAGGQNQCFENAAEAAARDSRLTYMEGVYLPTSNIPVPHGWCVDADGVVELTFPTDADTFARGVDHRGVAILPPDHWGYWGVRLTPELVRWSFDQFETFGLFDNPYAEDAMKQMASSGHDPAGFSEPTHGFPLLKVPYDPTRTEL